MKSARLALVSTLAVSTSRPRDFYTHATLEEGIRCVKALYGVDFTEARLPREQGAPTRARLGGVPRGRLGSPTGAACLLERDRDR